MSELKRFGKALRRLINSPEVFALLPEGDWGAGGCWELAAALVEFMGPPAELWAIVTKKHKDMVDHVVVKYDDIYIDYNGAQTIDELYQNISEDPTYGRDPKLVRFTKALQEKTTDLGYVPCDPLIVKALRSALYRAFGDAA